MVLDGTLIPDSGLSVSFVYLYKFSHRGVRGTGEAYSAGEFGRQRAVRCECSWPPLE